MTTSKVPTRDQAITTCPAWCTSGSEQYPCRGDHYDIATYLPASGGRSDCITPETGAAWPVVGVGLTFCEMKDEDECPTIMIHVTGYGPGDRDIDENVFLRPREAADLIEVLQGRLAALGGGAELGSAGVLDGLSQ
jgi:hypothetical protein